MLILRFGLIVLIGLITFRAAAAFETKAQNVILMDYQTGSILFSKAAGQRFAPASMTKIMTAYVLMSDLSKGIVSLDDEFVVSNKAYSMEGSRTFLEIGQRVRIDELLLGLIVQSGNDAAVVIAEGLAGSEAAFAWRMTNLARKMGAQDSNFINASGLPDPDHYSTAQDIALISRHAIEDFPKLYSIYSEITYTFNGIKQYNRNGLLRRLAGVDGIKTGYTRDTGYGASVSAERVGRRLILVATGLQSELERTSELERLLEWGFRAWYNQEVIKASQVVYQLPVRLGTEDYVDLVSRNSVLMSLPSDASETPVLLLRYNYPLIAPLTTDQAIASLEVILAGQSKLVDLFPKMMVADGGILARFGYNFRSLFGLRSIN